MELLWSLHAHINKVSCCQLKVVIVALHAREEAKLVLLEGSHDRLKQTSLGILKLLRIDKNQLVLEKLR